MPVVLHHALRVAGESRIGRHHFDTLAVGERVDGLPDLHDRAGALQSAGVDLQGFHEPGGTLRVRVGGFGLCGVCRRAVFDRGGSRGVGPVTSREVLHLPESVCRQNPLRQVAPQSDGAEDVNGLVFGNFVQPVA